MSPPDAAPSPGAGAFPGPTSDHCAFCHAPMNADQEWCLECGLGRTIIRRPPDWRLPVVVVSAIVLLAAIALAIALINVGSAGSTTTVTRTVATPGATRPSVTATGLLSWPPGLSGWTVVLDATPDHGAAIADADHLRSAGVADVGVLDTTQHPRLRPGRFYVFVNRFPLQTDAQAAAQTLAGHGHPGGVVREIAAPGGI